MVSRLETQAKMNVINKSFAGIVKSLERALNTNNLEQARLTAKMILFLNVVAGRRAHVLPARIMLQTRRLL